MNRLTASAAALAVLFVVATTEAADKGPEGKVFLYNNGGLYCTL